MSFFKPHYLHLETREWYEYVGEATDIKDGYDPQLIIYCNSLGKSFVMKKSEFYDGRFVHYTEVAANYKKPLKPNDDLTYYRIDWRIYKGYGDVVAHLAVFPNEYNLKEVDKMLEHVNRKILEQPNQKTETKPMCEAPDTIKLPYPKPEVEYMLVPTEPTQAMLDAYDEARHATTISPPSGRETYNPHQAYWAMLNAVPKSKSFHE